MNFVRCPSILFQFSSTNESFVYLLKRYSRTYDNKQETNVLVRTLRIFINPKHPLLVLMKSSIFMKVQESPSKNVTSLDSHIHALPKPTNKNDVMQNTRITLIKHSHPHKKLIITKNKPKTNKQSKQAKYRERFRLIATAFTGKQWKATTYLVLPPKKKLSKNRKKEET